MTRRHALALAATTILVLPIVHAQIMPTMPLTVTASAVEVSLQKHIIEPWYPRAVDTKAGGFHQNYATDWKELPDDKRGVVYQSRLTWVAAQMAIRAPKGSAEAERWQDTVRHGVAYLSSTLWDEKNGGFYFEITPDGKPDTDRRGEKHVYGAAFGIYALCAAFEATGDKNALALASRTFDYLEKHAHDAKNGGYHEALTRENTLILSPTATATGNPIGAPYGYKTMNTHIHLLESFTSLYRVAPSPLVKTRLAETFYIVRDKVAVEPGCLNLYLTADFRAVPGHDSFGHDVETAYLLIEAAHGLGDHDRRTETVARALVDHALDYGYDTRNGGFYDEGTAFGKPSNTAKIWWTQGEGLNALLLMDTLHGKDTPRYRDAFVKTWDFVTRHQIDATNTGWHTEVAADGTPPRTETKSDFWKDPYHQARALLTIHETLTKREAKP